MDGSNATGEVLVVNQLESALFNHSLEGFLVRKLADALDEVLVRLEIIGNHLTNDGDHLMGVEVVETVQNKQDCNGGRINVLDVHHTFSEGHCSLD